MAREHIKEQFRLKIIKLFEIDNIKPDDEFRNYEEWDSKAYLSVIAMIDENYDIVITGEDFEKLIMIQDISHYINNNH